MNISGIVKQEEEFIAVIEEETTVIDHSIDQYAFERDSLMREIDRLMKNSNKLKDSVNVLVSSDSFLNCESRFLNVNPEEFTLDNYSDIEGYIEALSKLIGDFESDKWRNIISWIEEHPKFYKFKQNATANKTRATRTHISDFFQYTKNEIDELEKVSLGVFGRSLEDQAALYVLYSTFKEYADYEEELSEAINSYKC